MRRGLRRRGSWSCGLTLTKVSQITRWKIKPYAQGEEEREGEDGEEGGRGCRGGRERQRPGRVREGEGK